MKMIKTAGKPRTRTHEESQYHFRAVTKMVSPQSGAGK